VLNLGGNAIKFTPDGGSVAVSLTRTPASCVLCVADTGIGISEEDQPRVRGRFYRSSEAYRLAVPGSGLGLSVVDTIVAAHGGTIDIASEPGEGTTVTVALPLLDGHGSGT
jgi:signal transduction histidine kinase